MWKRLLKAVVPRSWREARHRRAAARADEPFAGRPPAEVFEAVYRERVWGGSGDADFYSGEGSHDPEIVGPYVAAVSEFLRSLPAKPRAVDLGCGDFNVGSRLRPLCSEYVACDIVPSLIERNRRVFADRDVEFRALDMAAEPLPAGDVVFLRQVLQHMSNEQIARVLPKLAQYRWAVITEHVPGHPGFTPNLEKPPGPGIRVAHGSGIVLAAPPFSFRARSERELCRIEKVGTIRTVVYELG
jgi:hypothetical protein